MTDEEMITLYRKGSDLMFTSDFENAVIAREQMIQTCTDVRLAELTHLAIAIDCYYGPQSSFLRQCAGESAKRLQAWSEYTECSDLHEFEWRKRSDETT